MREPTKNLSHILISRRDEDLIPAFVIEDTEYLIYSKVPAEAIIVLTTAENQVLGMRDYVSACLAKQDQRDKFVALMDDISVEGLSEIIEEIVSKTTPFDGAKPSA